MSSLAPLVVRAVLSTDWTGEPGTELVTVCGPESTPPDGPFTDAEIAVFCDPVLSPQDRALLVEYAEGLRQAARREARASGRTERASSE